MDIKIIEIVGSPKREHVVKKESKIPPVSCLKVCKNSNGSIRMLIVSPLNLIKSLGYLLFCTLF